jgi:hypothetical protein
MVEIRKIEIAELRLKIALIRIGLIIPPRQPNGGLPLGINSSLTKN